MVEVVEVVLLVDVVLVMVACMVDKNVFETTVALAVTTCEYVEADYGYHLGVEQMTEDGQLLHGLAV